MPRPLPVEIRNRVKLLCLQGIAPPLIANELGVKLKTVYKLRSRQGWDKEATESRELLEKMGQKSLVQQAGDIQGKGKQIRDRLANVLDTFVSLLEQCPPDDLAALATSSKGEGLASVLKRLTDSADTVFNFSEKQPENPLVILGLFNDPPPSPRPEPQPLDIVSTVS